MHLATVLRADWRRQDSQLDERKLFEVSHAFQAARIWADVQPMENSDFESLLSSLTSNLAEIGLAFDRCEIDVIDGTIEEPTLDAITERGFHYTTYTLGPGGEIRSESYHLTAPFLPMCQGPIERFIDGRPWRGRSENTAIVEVPTSRFARMRLIANSKKNFTEADVGTLEQFVVAIALGDERYLNIRRNPGRVGLAADFRRSYRSSASEERSAAG